MAIAGTGCGGSERPAGARSASAGTAPGAIVVGDYFFKPGARAVKTGERITWTNAGKIPHNVIGNGAFRSRQLDPGDSYAFTFKNTGTYSYLCTLHPTLMSGKVVVR